MSDRLDKLVREAREAGARDCRQVDWGKVDQGLFARLQHERRVERMHVATQVRGGRGLVWSGGAVALAAAATFALVVGKTRETRTPAEGLVVASDVAGSVSAVAGGGQLIVDGKPATVGATLHLGDVVEARGASVTVDRPGKLTWVLEANSQARVTHVQGALVLALDRGAVEAQVVPVSAGEAFAVDVEGARVAVHGTHLRVARGGAAERVSVDLSEGVVVVGAAPRVGSTVGTLVSAPAHAEFDALDTNGSMTVTHDPTAVRAPVALGPATASLGSAVALIPPQAPKLTDPRPPAQVIRPRAAVSTNATAAPVVPQPPQPDPNAASVLAAAVRSCMAARTSAENVTVVVSTTLHVDLDADGSVRAARFDPPVAPDVNVCAAPVIYRTRFTHDGSADVSVDFRVRGPGQSAQ